MNTTTIAKPTSVFTQAALNKKSPGMLSAINTDMIRSLFFVRIAQLQLSSLGKSEVLTEEVKESIHNTAGALRQYDMKYRSKLDVKDAKWLSDELKKDKLYDISNLIELSAQVSSSGQETDYEMFMTLMTQFLERTVYLQARKGKLDIKKYKALFRFLTEEMVAEAENGQTAVEYNTAEDSLSMRLVQPDSQIPATLTAKQTA